MKIIIKVILFLTILFFFGCGTKEYAPTGKLNVVVSIVPYADFVKQIGGDKVNVEILIPANENPHTFEPSPTSIKLIENADIIFKVGDPFKFETIFYDKYNFANDSLIIVDCSEGLRKINGNPHMWLSISNAEQIVLGILNTLLKASPENKNYFLERYETYSKHLINLEEELAKNFEQLESRTLMVFHPAWTYFAEEFDLEEISIEHDGKAPKVKQLKDLIDLAENRNVKAIFVDSRSDVSNAKAIADQLKISVSQINPLPTNYLENMKKVGEEIMRYNN
jgi:zinc transport system substrate-binding protein